MNIELICNTCEFAGFCKYYKYYRSNKLKDLFIPEFLVVEVYNGKLYIIDCGKYKSFFSRGV